MEMRRYHKIPCISYKDHVTNREVRAKIQQAIRPHKDFLAFIKRRKLKFYESLPFIRSSQNYLARHSERGRENNNNNKTSKQNKTRQKEEELGIQHQGMDRPVVHQVPEGCGEQRKMEETGCEVICGAPTTLVVNR